MSGSTRATRPVGPTSTCTVGVGDVALIDALDACDAAAEEIGMPVQPIMVSPDEWRQRSSAFAADVQSRPTVRLLPDVPVAV